MKNKIAKEFGRKLTVQRKKKNMLQTELGLRCEFSKNYIGMLERAEKNVTLEKVYILAKALDCSVTDLIPTDGDVEV